MVHRDMNSQPSTGPSAIHYTRESFSQLSGQQWLSYYALLKQVKPSMSVATSSNQLATSWIPMSLGVGKSQFPEMLGVTGMNWASG